MVDFDKMRRGFEEEMGVLEESIQNDLDEAAEIFEQEILRGIGPHTWSGDYAKGIRKWKYGNKWLFVNETSYSDFVDDGIIKTEGSFKFKPFSSKGEWTRLGLWAISKLGYTITGEINSKGYFELMSPDGTPSTGLVITHVGYNIMKEAARRAMRQTAGDVEIGVHDNKGLIELVQG